MKDEVLDMTVHLLGADFEVTKEVAQIGERHVLLALDDGEFAIVRRKKGAYGKGEKFSLEALQDIVTAVEHL